MFKEIMKSGLLEMKKNYGTKVENVLTGLKIGIQQKFYEVGIEFYENFANKFGKENELVQKSFNGMKILKNIILTIQNLTKVLNFQIQ